jgi:hypothetical protein
VIYIPTIEIVSINRNNKIKIPKEKYPFWIRQEYKLNSHRGLFQDYLDKSEGVILHLGNLDMKNHSPFYFGNKLIDWDFESSDGDDSKFRFLPQHFLGVQNLLYRAWCGSPELKAFFLTDIQLSFHIFDESFDLSAYPSEESNIKQNYTLNEFIKEHEKTGLTWNTLYEITRNV